VSRFLMGSCLKWDRTIDGVKSLLPCYSVLLLLLLLCGVCLFWVAALCLTGSSACQQGAVHFVFIMGRIKLAQLSYLWLVTELIL